MNKKIIINKKTEYMRKGISVDILNGKTGIIVTSGKEVLAFTKIGVPNKQLKHIIHDDKKIKLTITSISGSPNRKTLKRNFGELIDAAKKEVDLSDFTLIRRLTVNKYKKRHAS